MGPDSNLSAALDQGFSPRGLAVYGASSRPGAMGALLMQRMMARGYGGDLVLVSARAQEVAGQASVLSAQGQDKPIDHALIVVPAEAVPAALADAAAAGARVATIFSSGFSEIGAEGAAADAQMRAVIRETGIRVLGPNCLGFISFRDNIQGSTLNLPNVPAGVITVVGQSGSVSARLAAGIAATGAGLDLLVTIGNSVDVGPARMIEYLAGRETTKVVVLYLESLGPPAEMRAALKAARAAGKEIVVLKSGRTEAGARTAASHTGATASKDMFVDLLLKECDVVRAETVQDACDLASLLSRVGRLKGRALVVAPSGGDCTLAADLCSQLDIPLAVIRPQAQAAMRARVPICAPENPVDPTTSGMRLGEFEPFLNIPASEPDVDYLIFMTSTTLIRPEASQNTLNGLYLAQSKGLQVVVGAPVSAESRAALAAAGIALVEDSERVFRTVRRVLEVPSERARPAAPSSTDHGSAPG